MQARIAQMRASMRGRRPERGPAEFDLSWRGPWVPCAFPERHREHAPECCQWPDMAKVHRAVQTVQRGELLALIGNRGTGKTQMAYMLAQLLGLKTCYFRSDDLFRAIKSWFALSSQDSAHNLTMLKRVPLLVIDESQERLGTEFEDQTLTAIVDKRYGEQLPTVLISNQKPDEFARNVGPSIASRITEGGYVLVADWASYRKAVPA
jgi:DNA replication protein DnaC